MVEKYNYISVNAKITTANIQGKTVSIFLSNNGKLMVACPETEKVCTIPWDSIIYKAVSEGLLIQDVNREEVKKNEQQLRKGFK